VAASSSSSPADLASLDTDLATLRQLELDLAADLI
jgi:hypothetical protein